MKPLSTAIYLKSNIKKVLPGFVCMALGVFIIYFFSTVVYSSIYEINRGYLNMFKKVTSIKTNNKDPIPDKILNKIKASNNIEYIIPVVGCIGSFIYESPFGNMNTCAYNVFKEDIPKILKAFDIKLVDGKLPSSNSYELLIPLKVAKQNNIKVGDYLSKDTSLNVVLNRKYKVCGLVDGNVDTMITTNTGNIKREDVLRRSLIFSLKNNNNKVIIDELMSMKENKVIIFDYKAAFNSMRDVFNVIDFIRLALNFIVIIVLCISLGNLNYILFLNRKDEFAILTAIGYKKINLYIKLLKENVVLNLLGFIFGIIITIIIIKLLNIIIFEPKGQYVYSFQLKSIFMAFIVPIAVSIANMISISRKLEIINYDYINI